MGPEEEAWIRDLWPRVHALARRMLGNDPDARDAAQEAFLKALERWETQLGPGTREGWVVRIATRVCLDALEKRRRAGGALDAEALPAPAPAEEPVEVRDRLEPCLQDLPPQQRAAFVLRDMEGLPFERLAEALECSQATVRVHLMKARLSLRAGWLKRYGERP